MKEIKRAVKLMQANGLNKKKLTILHCNSSYPTSPNQLNLNVIGYLKNKFKVDTGLSDHSNSIVAPLAAVAMGAKVIEKHFTLNRSQEGPDHAASLNPRDLKKMVQGIRYVEIALGKSKKHVTSSEKLNKKFSRKSIVANKLILKGERFSIDNLAIKRPGNGISPMQWRKLLSKRSKKIFHKDELIKI